MLKLFRSKQYSPLPNHHDKIGEDSLEQSEPLVTDSQNSIKRTSRTSQWRVWRVAFGIAFCLFCIGLAAAFISGSLSQLIASNRKWTHCGSTVEEAHARGCQYDVMIGSWLLPECFDAELMERYLADRDWEFFRDSNLSQVLPMDELRRGEHSYPVWATVQQHQYHCAYIWEKQFRSAVAGELMDDLSASVHHTHHCATGLANGMPGAKENLALAVKYFSCVRAGEGNPRRENNPNNTLVKIP